MVSLSLSSIVYNRSGYIEIVEGLAKQSMMAAVEEVKALPQYASDGEVGMCTLLYP